MRTQRKRVLMVLNRYYPIIGGAENQCRILMNELKKSNVEVVGVVTHRYSKNLERIYSLDDVIIFRLGRYGKNKLSLLSFYFELFWFLIKNRANIDIIHVHTVSVTSFICTLFSFLFRKKSLQKLTISGEIASLMKLKDFKGFVMRSLLRFTFKIGNTIVLTNEGENEIKKYSHSCQNYFKVNNGIDSAIFHRINKSEEVRQKYGFDTKSVYLGFVGRLTRVKGILELCHYIIKYNEINEKSLFKLAIMGSGKYQIDSVEEEIKQLCKINSDILLISPEHQPVDFYNAIDIYVSNSTKEGMPNTVLEALCCGKNIILSDIPAHAELKEENQNAVIYTFRGEKELFELMENIKIGKKSNISNKFLIKNVALRYRNIYHTI